MYFHLSITFQKLGKSRNLLEITVHSLSCSYRLIVKHEGVNSIYFFFTTLHMFVKQLHNKLWKIQNSSVILDKY
jgi:hypothetical protein